MSGGTGRDRLSGDLSTTYQPLSNALADRYRIERQLGQGGMATVYLAHDIKHDRKVAVKVLKPELAAVLGAERFVVEIKTTASLQHPHILPLFDSGTADGFLYYVMPYIEGETLRDKLRRETQFGIDEAVRITTQVADALDYAHRHGVIHRDIKPENILLHDGRPMVADFGIALAVSAAAGGRMTETGLSLGTPHYMSPEQATADKDITARSDIYSLASVLYEMLAGQPPHMGNSAQMIIMRIIAEPVEAVTKLRRTVPPNVAAALAKALEKLPADRFESAKAFADALGNATFSTRAVSGHGSLTGRGSSVSGLPFIAAASIAVIATVAAIWGWSTHSAPSVIEPPIVATLALSRDDSIIGSASNAGRPNRTALAISPDGSTLVFVGERNGVRQLLRRPLGGESSTPIPGTEGGESPFFSPNGLHVGFYSRGRLMRVALAGGPPSEISAVARLSGGSWSDGDRIAVGTDLAGVIVFSANGAEPPDTVLGPGALLPYFLPGGKALLFSHRSLSPGLPNARVEVLDLESGVRKILVKDGADARYVSTGHIVFGRAGTLLAAPFDPSSLSLTGSPVVVLDDVMQALNGANAEDVTAALQVAISPLGYLVYLTGGVTPDRPRPLMWLDRQGKATPIPAAGNRPYFAVRLSPDDRQAVATTMGRVPGVHVIDFARGSVTTLAVRDFQLWPLWSPDGKRVVHHATVRDSASLGWSLADGSRPPSPLVPDKVILGDPAFWALDGTKLYNVPEWGDSSCLYEISMSSGDRKRVEELPLDCSDPTLSPDGRWIAYAAVEPGATRPQVFVQTWPALDRKWNVSVTFGSRPVWTRGGRELIFTVDQPVDSAGNTPQQVMSVEISDGAAFTFRPPRALFTAVFGSSEPLRAFDVTKHGSRFLVASVTRLQSPAGEPRLIVNWFTQLRRLSVQQGNR